MHTEPALGLAVLADGMGGYNAGEVASLMAVEAAVRSINETRAIDQPPADPSMSPRARAALQAVEISNDIVLQAAQSNAQYQGMGTTLVVAQFHADSLAVAYVGDSRLYRYRNEQLEQITTDHSLLQELIDRGFLTPEEAAHSLNRNILTRAVGVEAAVEIDVCEEQVLPEDIYLLCSDGLSDLVIDEQIRLTIKDFSDNLQVVAEQLIARANQNGGDDNVSVILVKAQLRSTASVDLQQHYSI